MVDQENPLAIKLRKQMVQTISSYNLLAAGDRVMVCVSGGKDSSILLALLRETQRRAPFAFSLHAVMLDQKQPGFDGRGYKSWVENEVGIPLTVLERDTYSVVIEKTVDRVFCALCSRLRRGILYEHAFENKFNKMALGHHREDAAETLLLNLFYTGKMQAMPPVFLSDDQRNLVIRPLLEIAEADLQELSTAWKIPVIPCNLCGSQEGMKRKQIKRLITDLEKTIPGIRQSMAGAIGNIRISHLADQRVWSFKELSSSIPLPEAPAKATSPLEHF